MLIYQEFAFGMGDGIGGMVTQPLEGAQKEGFAGFLKGFGKGVGGLMLKPAAGMLRMSAQNSANINSHLGHSCVYCKRRLGRNEETHGSKCTKLHSRISHCSRL